MNWTHERIKTLMLAVQIALVAVVILGIILFLWSKFWIIGAILTLVPFLYLLVGLVSIPEEQRHLTQVFGAYYRTLGPGLHVIYRGVEKIRGFVSVWEQRYPLFEGESTKIDCRDGSIVPKKAFAFVECREEDDPDAPRKMIFEVKDVKGAATALVESVLISHLNRKEVKEALEERGGCDIFDKMDLSVQEDLEKGLEKWGLKLNRIIVGDFELDKRVIAAREAILEQEAAELAAKYEKQARAQAIMGSFLEMVALGRGISVDEFTAVVREDTGLQEKILEISADLLERRMALDRGALVDIRTANGNPLLDLVALWHKMSSGNGGPKLKPQPRTGKEGKGPGDSEGQET